MLSTPHDIPGLFFWQDKKTKAKVEYTPVESGDWFATVDRLCDMAKLKEMLNQYGNIVMAGTISSDNQREFISVFDKTILLQCDPDTIIHRMETRTNKSGYGKTKAEQEDNIEWQKEFDPLLISLGAVPVDTRGELGQVIEKIISEIQ